MHHDSKPHIPVVIFLKSKNTTDNTHVILWYNTHKAPFRKCEERKKKNSSLWTNIEVLLLKVQWKSSDEFQKGILLD